MDFTNPNTSQTHKNIRGPRHYENYKPDVRAQNNDDIHPCKCAVNLKKNIFFKS